MLDIGGVECCSIFLAIMVVDGSPAYAAAVIAQWVLYSEIPTSEQ